MRFCTMVQNCFILEHLDVFEPPERPVLLPAPGNSHTPDPMRSVTFVASSDYIRANFVYFYY